VVTWTEASRGNGLRVTADEERCCGSGMCVLSAPDVFGQREEDGVVDVLVPLPGPDLLPSVRTAVQSCPTSAIRLADRHA
jgi:ferredoxin